MERLPRGLVDVLQALAVLSAFIALHASAVQTSLITIATADRGLLESRPLGHEAVGFAQHSNVSTVV